MEVTDVRIKLIDNPMDKIKAWASVELDRTLAIRDIKVIDAGDGLFLSMPSRKTTDNCPECKGKNFNVAKFCNWCGLKLAENRVRSRPDGKADLWHDITFPTTPGFRKHMEDKILDEYERLADLRDGYRGEPSPPVMESDPIAKIEARHGE